MVPRRLAWFILLEPRLWLCLFGQLRRRRPGTSTFRYDGGLRALLTVTIVLVIVEGVVVDGLVALLAPDPVWLWVLLGVHVYGLGMLAALRASFATHPHRVTPTGLHLNDGIFSIVGIPYSAIRAIYPARQHYFGRSGLEIDRARREATLAFGDTTVEIKLDPDRPIVIDGTVARCVPRPPRRWLPHYIVRPGTAGPSPQPAGRNPLSLRHQRTRRWRLISFGDWILRLTCRDFYLAWRGLPMDR